MSSSNRLSNLSVSLNNLTAGSGRSARSVFGNLGLDNNVTSSLMRNNNNNNNTVNRNALRARARRALREGFPAQQLRNILRQLNNGPTTQNDRNLIQQLQFQLLPVRQQMQYIPRRPNISPEILRQAARRYYSTPRRLNFEESSTPRKRLKQNVEKVNIPNNRPVDPISLNTFQPGDFAVRVRQNGYNKYYKPNGFNKWFGNNWRTLPSSSNAFISRKTLPETRARVKRRNVQMVLFTGKRKRNNETTNLNALAEEAPRKRNNFNSNNEYFSYLSKGKWKRRRI